MRVIRWRKADTGVESLTITENGVYFPVGKTDSGFKLKLSMASAGQYAFVDVARSANGDRAGYSAVSVFGTTEIKAPATLSLRYGIVVSGISGTLNAILDDETPVTNFPDAGGGRFAAKEDVDAYYYGASVPAGFQATANGVPYTYQGGGVGWKPSGLPAYADYATLSLQTPTVGRIAQIPRLCGNGYFALRANGTRWEVFPGESIVRDAGPASAGYDLTATGTTYVALASYTIPAGMIGDGEEWEFDIHAMTLEIHASGSNYVDAYVGGTKLLGTAPLLSAVNQVARKRGAFVRLNNTLAMRVGTVSADLYSAVANNDAVVDVSTQQEVTAGFAPGAVTNKMRLRHICLRRIG